MKSNTYQTPEVEIISTSVRDVICSSNDPFVDDEYTTFVLGGIQP